MELNEDFEVSDDEEAEEQGELVEEFERDERRATQMKDKFQASLETNPCSKSQTTSAS